MPSGSCIKLFEGLSEETRRELLALAQCRTAGPGTILFHEGGPAQSVHVLASGFVRMAQTTATGARVILRYVAPGETFGTPALLRGGIYPGDAIAVTACTEMQWPARTIGDLLAQQPRVWMNVVTELETRLRDMEERLRDLSNEPVERRIAYAVVRLVRKVGQPISDVIEVPFPLSRQDIGDLTGTTLHTVSRTLGVWERQGLIERGRQRISVLNLAGLAVLAEGGIMGETLPRRTHRRASVSR
jgi:CRP/FNR family transcriptional regulator, nitrogen oxide reductase regulator